MHEEGQRFLANCINPKGNFCEDFNHSLQYNICDRYDRILNSEFNDSRIACDLLTIIMYVVGYCNQLMIAGERNIMSCLEKYGMPASLCSSVYFDLSRDTFHECFYFFASNIADLSRNNKSATEWFWETLETTCAHPNASEILLCSGVRNIHTLLFNITWYCSTEYIFILNGYVCPILACFILVTNILMIIVMLQVFNNASLKLLLGVNAFVDILGPMMISLIFFPFIGLGYYKDYMEFHWCIISSAIINVVSPMLHGASIWLLLGLAVQRFLVVKFPLKIKTLSADRLKNTALLYILFVFAVLPILFIKDIQLLFSFEMFPILSKADITKTIYTARIYSTTEYDYIQGTSYILRSVFIQMIPTTLMLIFEIGLVTALQKQNAKRNKLSKGSSTPDKNLIVNVLTATIVAGVLIVEIPTMFFLLCTILSRRYGYSFMSDTALQNSSGTINILALLIYQINLIICCCISKDFRVRLLSLFKP